MCEKNDKVESSKPPLLLRFPTYESLVPPSFLPATGFPNHRPTLAPVTTQSVPSPNSQLAADPSWNPYEQYSQYPQNSSYPQQNTYLEYEQPCYSASNVQSAGCLQEHAGSHTQLSHTDYSTSQTYNSPLATDVIKLPPISLSERDCSFSVYDDQGYIKSNSKRNAKKLQEKNKYLNSRYDDRIYSSRNRNYKYSKYSDNSDYKKSSTTRLHHENYRQSYHSKEKSTFRDLKHQSSKSLNTSELSKSHGKSQLQSITNNKKSSDVLLTKKNCSNQEKFEDRKPPLNSIEKACDNIQLSDENTDEDEPLLKRWYRSSPSEIYYAAVKEKTGVVESTSRGRKIADMVREILIARGKNARSPSGEEPIIHFHTRWPKLCKHKSERVSSSESDNNEADHAMQELEREQQHPRRLHPEMWYNNTGQLYDGPLCRCSDHTRGQGIHHGVYAGETRPIPCDVYTNNADRLYHYRITVSPPTNFLIKTLTVINHDEHEFLFSGFSLLSHNPITELPTCKVIRFNIEYTILYIEEQAPVNYTIEELELFEEFLFQEILELVDFDIGKRTEDGCSQFHLLPRWERALAGGGGEVLSMVEVLKHLVKSSGLLISENSLKILHAASQREWESFVDGVRGMIVTYPGKKPCSLRVDQLDRSLSDNIKGSKESVNDDPCRYESIYPEIVHFGIRPPQLSYAGNPEYKKAWRDYVKLRHLVANMDKPSYDDKRKLESKEAHLQEMRTQTKMKRDVTIALSAEGFYRTGIMCDVVQHAMLIPVLISHLRFHNSLDNLEKTIDYKFKNRALLQLALTHPSYRGNFGTNPDHARNSLTNCGIRQPEYGDRKIHYMNTRKRGINTLINIMSRFGKQQETESAISHNERLEFLGDAVIEFISSIHLFKMFSSLEEGGLVTYRASLVQNQHLALLAKKLDLEQYMLYAHGSDLCHDLELRRAMANCFEALMGALFLDGGIDVADRVFTIPLWKDLPDLCETWSLARQHPLQEQEPYGDRQWIDQYPFLQNLTKFEDSIGVQFKHIRLLARAFTDRSMGFTNLTLGSNQRLEFLGDAVLQLVTSEYLYKHFPEHHEGHLSLLRSSLVSNRTLAVVCDDLAMCSYAVYYNPKAEYKTKNKADLLEAFLGALYIDKNMVYCQKFCSVCLFPRLREFIMNQEWNDPKSKLQQCCLILRTMDDTEPDIPIYKVIECVGPANTREYTVAVYFQGVRLASAHGHTIQEAEMNAAKLALTNSHNLFPQLNRQKGVITTSMKRQRHNVRGDKYSKMDDNDYNEDRSSCKERGESSHKDQLSLDCSSNEKKKKSEKFSIFKDTNKLPMAYRPDRFDNRNDDSGDASTNINLLDLSDIESDIVYPDSESDLDVKI